MAFFFLQWQKQAHIKRGHFKLRIKNEGIPKQMSNVMVPVSLFYIQPKCTPSGGNTKFTALLTGAREMRTDLSIISQPLKPQGSSTITANMSLQTLHIFTFPGRCPRACICICASNKDVSNPVQHFPEPSDIENYTQWIHFSLWSQEGEIARRADRQQNTEGGVKA